MDLCGPFGFVLLNILSSTYISECWPLLLRHPLSRSLTILGPSYRRCLDQQRLQLWTKPRIPLLHKLPHSYSTGWWQSTVSKDGNTGPCLTKFLIDFQWDPTVSDCFRYIVYYNTCWKHTCCNTYIFILAGAGVIIVPLIFNLVLFTDFNFVLPCIIV